MTQGSVSVLLIQFALPILLGQIFQNLYNSVDSLIVGQFVGKEALAAVTCCSDISQLLVGFFTGLSAGAGILLSRLYGAKDHPTLRRALHTALVFSSILGLFMALMGIVSTPLLLSLTECPQDVYGLAVLYLQVYFVGILFSSLYNMGAGILRAVGDSKRPLAYLIIASTINILLDVLFVVELKLGVMGVAMATVISQFLSVMLVVQQLMCKGQLYQLSIRELYVDWRLLKEIVNLGIPAALQASLLSLSNLFVQRYINLFGSAAMAGVGAAKKIDKFIGLISQSLGLAITTFISQNLGANRPDRALHSIRICFFLCLSSISVLGIPTYFFAEKLMGLFTSDVNAIQFGVETMRTMLPLYIFQSINQIYSNASRGFGHSQMVMVLSLTGMIICRQIFLLVSFQISPAIQNVYLCFPVGWGCSACFVWVYFQLVKKRSID